MIDEQRPPIPIEEAMQELLAMMTARERCQLCGFTAETCEKLPRPCCEDCTHGRDDTGSIVLVSPSRP